LHILSNHTVFAWALPFVCLYFGWFLYHSIYKLKDPWQVIVIKALAVTYPIGELMQYALVGPGFIRWYLSDIGFVAVPAAFLFVVPRITWGTALDLGKRLTTAAFIIGGSLELFFWKIQPSEPIPNAMVRGDLIDVTIFVIVYILVLILLLNLEEKINQPPIVETPKRKKKKKKSSSFVRNNPVASLFWVAAFLLHNQLLQHFNTTPDILPLPIQF